MPEDHGVVVLSRLLDALDGRTVTVRVNGSASHASGGTAIGPTREDIERIAAEVTQRMLDYRERRR